MANSNSTAKVLTYVMTQSWPKLWQILRSTTEVLTYFTAYNLSQSCGNYLVPFMDLHILQHTTLAKVVANT